MHHAVFGPGGATVLAATTVAASGTLNDGVSITATADGGYAVSYESDGSATGALDVMLSRFDASGAQLTTLNVSNPNAAASTLAELDSHVFALAGSYVGVVYEDNTFSDTDTVLAIVDTQTAQVLFTDAFSVGSAALTNQGIDPVAALTAANGLVMFQRDDTANTITGSLFSLTRLVTSDAASDTLVASSLRDSFNGGTGLDIVSYAGLTQGVTVALASGGTAGAAQGDTYANIDGVLGSAVADTIYGNTLANVISGLAGRDTLFGGAGDDTVSGGDDNDYLEGGSNRDTVRGEAGNDHVFDIDSVDGDVLDGGTGTGDWLDYSAHNTSGFTINLASGLIQATLVPTTTETILNFEHLSAGLGDDRIVGSDAVNSLLGGTGNDQIYGGLGDDRMFGNDGNDTLSGGAGRDSILGGLGNDLFLLAGTEDADDMFGEGGTDTFSAAGLAAGASILANLSSGHLIVSPAIGTATDTTLSGIENVIGSSGNDILTGAGEDNSLSGGGGDDSLYGGIGNDQLFGGAAHDVLAGSIGRDTLDGGDGNDQIIVTGTDEGDVIRGGTGTDTFDGSLATGSGILLDLTLGEWARLTGAFVPLFTLTGIENAFGSAQNDQFYGGTGTNWFETGGGDDTAYGGTGHDTLYGGAGIDKLSGDDGNDYLSGDADAGTLFGGAGNDSLYGGDARDWLEGGTGADVMVGGLGNDRYWVDNAGDTILGETGFSLGGGIDTVESWVDYTLGSNLEILRLQGTADLSGFGNAAPESLVGNTGANTLGGAGGNDSLNGKAGDDRIVGGAGQDTLIGDTGNDTFVYTAISDSRAGAANRDFVNGFVHGQDRIDLSAIDASTLTGATNEAFTFITTAFTGVAGQLRAFTFGGGNLCIVEADTNGDATADMQIFVNLTTFMTGADFVL